MDGRLPERTAGSLRFPSPVQGLVHLGALRNEFPRRARFTALLLKCIIRYIIWHFTPDNDVRKLAFSNCLHGKRREIREKRRKKDMHELSE